MDEALEHHALVLFHGAVPRGSSSEPFSFDPTNGHLIYKEREIKYILFALLALKRPSTPLELPPHTSAATDQSTPLTYGHVTTALASAFNVQFHGNQIETVQIFDMTLKEDFHRLQGAVQTAWDIANRSEASVKQSGVADDINENDDIVLPETVEVEEFDELIGIDPSVYRQINASLKSGKKHLMLYGPPGTGKTSLARWIASNLIGGSSNVYVR